ncbi:MAG: hypothetical protein HYS80_02775, partial [Candidatus Aenigmarchaeota archaeon]|nr:hypothetical protein [Candidatus Aenigmarchaeota archaeon]
DLGNVQTWASVRVDPSALVVQPNDAKEVFVFVAPKEGVEGTKAFTVKTLSNGNVVSESQLMLDVVEPEGATAKQVFTWVFVVLLALLVLLVIVVLVKKATSREKGVESQTYY